MSSFLLSDFNWFHMDIRIAICKNHLLHLLCHHCWFTVDRFHCIDWHLVFYKSLLARTHNRSRYWMGILLGCSFECILSTTCSSSLCSITFLQCVYRLQFVCVANIWKHDLVDCHHLLYLYNIFGIQLWVNFNRISFLRHFNLFFPFSGISFLKNTRIFLTPMPILFVFYIVTIIIGWNICRTFANFYREFSFLWKCLRSRCTIHWPIEMSNYILGVLDVVWETPLTFITV